MAVARMKKIYLIAHSSLKSHIVSSLHQQGLLHIENIEDTILKNNLKESTVNNVPDLNEFDLILSKINFVIDFISPYKEKKKGLLSGLLKEKVKLSSYEFEKIEEKLNFEHVYRECETLDVELNKLNNKLNNLTNLEENLKPWVNLKIRLADFKGTKYVDLLIGKIANNFFDKFKEETEKDIPESFVDAVSSDSQNTNVLLVYHKNNTSKINSILSKYNFISTAFPNLSRTPNEEIFHIHSQYKIINERKSEIEERATKMVSLMPDFLALYDFFENKRRKKEIEEKFAHTKSSFMVEGWIEEAGISKLENIMVNISSEIEIDVFDPTEEDKPPIVLKNPKIIQPFEVITRLFGMPDYNELDPTPFLAPFFFLFFGIAMGDFGYGLVLLIACLWMKKKLEVSKNTKSFFDLIAYGGFASMIVGVFTGGYFAIDVKVLPEFLKSLMLFDPMKDIMIFLILSCALGVIHVCFGVAIEGYDNIRRGNISDAVFDQGVVLLFLLSLVAFGATGNSIAKWLAIAGTSGIIFFHGRESKNILSRIGGGLYSLYGMSSFIGDFLSYARLMALGLASVLIGWVINVLGLMVLDIPVIGIFFMAVIIIFGHGLNIVINLLGAFIHPLRLQYVEFFSKFYDDGGKKYKPFAVETKHLIITSSEMD
ncbi:MAG: V-type ATP synthase subunit I [Actinobacteria bacterium]|nr:V-type ATP synthase subunit I [Actinomycetota bacterium]